MYHILPQSPLCFLSLIPSMFLSLGFCPGRHRQFSWTVCLWGRISLPSFTLAGSSWSPAVVSSTLSFCSLRQKFRGLYGTGKYLGPEKPGALGSFAWAVLWASALCILSWSPFSAFPWLRPRLSQASDVSVFRAAPGLDSSQGGTR